MGPSRSATRTGAVAGVVLLLGCLVAACDPGDSPNPTPTTAPPASSATSETPTPTATASPTPSAEDTHIAEATQAAVAYKNAINRVMAHGFLNWREELASFWGTAELADNEGAFYEALVTEGVHAVGQLAVISTYTFDYTADAGDGQPQVRVGVCTNKEAIAYYYADGTALETVGLPQYVDEYLMKRRPDGTWLILEITSLSNQPC